MLLRTCFLDDLLFIYFWRNLWLIMVLKAWGISFDTARWLRSRYFLYFLHILLNEFARKGLYCHLQRLCSSSKAVKEPEQTGSPCLQTLIWTTCVFTESHLITVLLYDQADQRLTEVSWVGVKWTYMAFQCRNSSTKWRKMMQTGTYLQGV